MGLFSILNKLGRDVSNAEHTVVNSVTSGLARGYELTKEGATAFYKLDAGAGYDLGHFLRTGRFLPLNQAEKRGENLSTKGFLFNIPYELGVKTGKQLVQGSASILANTIPFTGTFGHLFANPRENLFNKASDVAFGILDTIGIGDAIQVAKKPVEEGVNLVTNTLAKRVLPGITDIQTPKISLPILHLPNIDIHLPDLNTLVKSLTGDNNAVIRSIQDLGNGIKRVVAKDFFTHIFDVNENLGKIEHSIVDKTGNIIKVGEHTENDVAKILGKDVSGIARGARNFLDRVYGFFRSKPVQYGLLGVGIGAPVVGGIVSGGSTNNTAGSTNNSNTSNTLQPSPSSPTPSSPVPGGSQSSDVLNPYSPQAQYYALQQTTQTGPTTPGAPTTSMATTKSIFSNPYIWIGIAIFITIIIVILVVR